MIIEITRDCACEHDVYEKKNYPREGLTIQRFKVGERFEVVRLWENYYGNYYRIKTGKSYGDVSIANAKIVIAGEKEQ